MYCNSCGQTIDDGAKYCPFCGAPQAASEENSSAQSSAGQASDAGQTYRYNNDTYYAGSNMNGNKATYQTYVERRTNGLCIAGFICSFFVPLLGLILSCVGLKQAKERNEGGTGLAIAGIVLGIIGTIVYIISIIACSFAASIPFFYYYY